MKQFVLGALSIFMLVLFVLLQLNIDDDVHVAKQFNDFNWLRNLNLLPSFVRPGVDTELFLPVNINGTKERDLIACFVLSSPKNVIARNAIRQTWGIAMKPLFVIALSDNETMSLVINEAELHNDIIVENFIDSYVNLTIKTAYAMKHFLRHFSNSKYFFKIDDDVYLNVENLMKMINDDALPKDAIVGRKVTDSKPHREKDSKLYIPYWLYEDEAFPPYHDGPSYIIPGHMVQSIFETSMKIPFFTIEDAFFLGEVAGKTLNYTLHDNRRFRTFRAPFTSPCFHNLYITIHRTFPAETIDLWSLTQRNYSCSLRDRLYSYYIFKKDMIF